MISSLRNMGHASAPFLAIAWCLLHYSDVIMGAMASQITCVSDVYTYICFDPSYRTVVVASIQILLGQQALDMAYLIIIDTVIYCPL